MKSLRIFLVIGLIITLTANGAEDTYGAYEKSISPKIKKYLDNAYMVQEVKKINKDIITTIVITAA